MAKKKRRQPRKARSIPASKSRTASPEPAPSETVPTSASDDGERVGLARKWIRAAGPVVQLLWAFFPARGVQVNALLAMAALALTFFASADWLMNAPLARQRLGALRFLAVIGALALSIALWVVTEPSPPDRLVRRPWTTSAEISWANGFCLACNGEIKVDDAGILYLSSNPGRGSDSANEVSLGFTDRPVVELNNPTSGSKVELPGDYEERQNSSNQEAPVSRGQPPTAPPAPSPQAPKVTSPGSGSGAKITFGGTIKDGRAEPTNIIVPESFKGRLKIYTPIEAHRFSIRSDREHIFVSGQRSFLVRLTRAIQDTPPTGGLTVYRFQFDIVEQLRTMTLRERFAQMRDTARSLPSLFGW